jgi:hypothetical protein
VVPDVRRRRDDLRVQRLPRHRAGAQTLLATVGKATSYADTAVTNGTRYFYRVAALNTRGEGQMSPEDSATPTATPPPAFPAAPLLDDFARAEGLLGASWRSPA